MSYNSREHLAKCLPSVFGSVLQRSLRVVVVDNASADGSADFVAGSFASVDLVRMPHNAGFAAATNVGLARTSAQFVLALNPDTELPQTALEALVGVMEAHAELGACGPRLVRPDGSFDHAARRAFPTVAGALAYFTRIDRLPFTPARLAQYRAPHVDGGPVDAVNGAFLLLRRAALDEVGSFDERYWMYMEDLDLCYRLREAGWLTWYEPSVVVTHVKHGSSGNLRSPRLNVAFHAGMARFYRTHYASRRRAPLDWLVHAGIGTKLAVSLVRTELRRRFARS